MRVVLMGKAKRWKAGWPCEGVSHGADSWRSYLTPAECVGGAEEGRGK